MILLILLLMLIATIISSIGSVLIKIGSGKIRISLNTKYMFSIKFLLDLLMNYRLILGLILYGISGIFFIYALRLGELSVVYPLASLTYVFVTLLSAYFLKEKINVYKWSGILLIMLGIVFIQL